jgi:hypothetical protein
MPLFALVQPHLVASKLGSQTLLGELYFMQQLIHLHQKIEWSVEHKDNVISFINFNAAVAYADGLAMKCKYVKLIQPESRQITLVPHPRAQTTNSGREFSERLHEQENQWQDE